MKKIFIITIILSVILWLGVNFSLPALAEETAAAEIISTSTPEITPTPPLAPSPVEGPQPQPSFDPAIAPGKATIRVLMPDGSIKKVLLKKILKNQNLLNTIF